VFGASQVNPTNTNPFYVALNGDSAQTINSPQFAGMAMPVSCTFTILQVTLVAISGGATDDVSVTLTKNGADTGLSCTATSSTTANAITSCNDTSPTVSAAVGDLFGYHLTQTNATPIVRIGIGARCN
jgi:hypothetical protein